ncbi:hypothetical protein HOD20_05280 [archaeon]|jgi:hypothetical protein|nr:hypothetical protein [archaeon]MBT4351915.1 hypothetical protein [archaeon]MBT4647464.1 hypothetical protein [archaeon]MBT6822039.1 hypothetical protein [archaeon]MBT7391633.1 hypothetical protein [archaeon]
MKEIIKRIISFVFILLLVSNFILLPLKIITPLIFWINIGMAFLFVKFVLNIKKD